MENDEAVSEGQTVFCQLDFVASDSCFDNNNLWEFEDFKRVFGPSKMKIAL
jgi:hypothetical protein